MIKKLNIAFSILVVLALILGLVLPFITNAQTVPGPTGPVTPGPTPPSGNQSYQIKIPNPLKNGQDDLPGLLVWIIDNAIIPIGGIVAALMIMYAGFMYVTARGNESQIKNAHNALLYGALGAAILLGARVLAAAIQGTINQIGS
jgi:hypothetical protein